MARTGASRTQSGNDVRTTSPRLRGELRVTLDILSHYSPVFTAPLAINSLRRRVQFFLDAAPEAGPPAASTAGVGAGAGPRSPAIRCASRTRHRLRNRETSGTSGPMRPNILIGSTGNHEVGVCYSCFDAGGGQQHRSIPTPQPGFARLRFRTSGARPILHLPQPLLGGASLRHEKCRLYDPLQDKMLANQGKPSGDR